MKTLGESNIWSYHGSEDQPVKIERATSARIADGHLVSTYLELAKKVAELQFLNKDFVLLFRGQPSDYHNSKSSSSLKPSILRPIRDKKLPPKRPVVEQRYKDLLSAEGKLIQAFEESNLGNVAELRRNRILRWSILQHYEVCMTPLLDVTHSLRIAASFAKKIDPETGRLNESGYVYVLAVPNISGAITTNADAGIQVIRLASVCPPVAVRPHIQEGYLLGEYPDMNSVDQKWEYRPHEIDFGRRLVGKFRFSPATFWDASTSFPPIDQRALLPLSNDDPFLLITDPIKAQFANQI